ncbi:MAG: MarC family protein, partial [Candidatus Coatesbacteria bacterium]
FIFGGKAIFLFLGVTIADFQIAGGIILLLLAISDLTSEPKQQRTPKIDDIGIVPIGMPLILGPAALTVLMMSLDNFGIIISLLSLTINLIIMNLVLLYSSRIQKVMGKAISSAFSKVMALLLGTIAVMMIRKGILSIIG